jgi:hypothetical protein
MEAMGISFIHNKKRRRSLTNSKKARGGGYSNLLLKEFSIAPRMGLSSDITHLKCDESFEYLCIIKYIVSGEVRGSHSGPRMTKAPSDRNVFVHGVSPWKGTESRIYFSR